MATENKNLSAYDKSTIPSARGLRFGIVVSEWNSNITEALCKGAIDTLTDCGAEANTIIRWDVPGSFELVFGCRKIIEKHQPDAVIAIGSVIQGETRHFDFVCEAVAQGIKDVNVTGKVPVIFCVLTDNTLQQAIDRSGGKHGNKGTEAAIAAIKMAVLGKK
ncbi:6,7-dimethyl-8-ribityllumazine synthase [Ascidiimonas aurantiaca]|uniref:6,7-dimethyl-8-ribityllumazine synthase n=1 Tax=Ascidiimonas aurantiaca TaxID=1685432 RepID=UPI0030EC86BB